MERRRLACAPWVPKQQKPAIERRIFGRSTAGIFSNKRSLLLHQRFVFITAEQ